MGNYVSEEVFEQTCASFDQIIGHHGKKWAIMIKNWANMIK
jgi:hypothetical protein